MSLSVVKRSVVLAGHKRSVSLEDAAFWELLKEIAGSGNMSLSDLITAIDFRKRHNGNLSSAIRLFVLNFYRETAPTDLISLISAGQFRG